jgi:hypothetical protein
MYDVQKLALKREGDAASGKTMRGIVLSPSAASRSAK